MSGYVRPVHNDGRSNHFDCKYWSKLFRGSLLIDAMHVHSKITPGMCRAMISTLIVVPYKFRSI